MSLTNPAERAKVLVVDDVRANLKLVAEHLVTTGAEVIGAHTGTLGLARAERERPSLILLDVLMPGIDGFETCRRLKSNPATRDIPVIFMTALDDVDDKIRGFDVGAVDYVTKPIQFKELIARVTNHLRIHALNQHLDAMVRQRTDELLESNRALRREVEQREQAVRELRVAREAAERASAAKSYFLANVNHELRTPLHSIIGTAHLLLDDEPEPGRRAMVDTIAQAGQVMLALVNNVLDYSKLEFERLELVRGRTDIRECVDSAIGLIAIRAAEKGLRLLVDVDPDVPPALELDGLRLQQVLLNLLSNAVKFTESGDISVRVHARDTNVDAPACGAVYELRILVEDPGIGIAPDDACHLFQRFYQVDPSASRRFGGTGIGLALSKKLVELMGGRIWVESEVGKGSRFQFTVSAPVSVGPAPPYLAPGARGSFPTIDAVPGGSAQGRSRTGTAAPTSHPELAILLADDNPINRRVSLALLERLGYHADAVNDGTAVLEALEARHYDLILMDVQMPEMDGVEATRHIRSRPSIASQPFIIALTANSMASDRARYLEAGMDEYLSKPFGPRELADVLACARRRMMREPDRAIGCRTRAATNGERAREPSSHGRTTE